MNNLLLELYDEEAEVLVEDESMIIYNRFKEICPPNKVEDMSDEQLLHDCGIAFQIIGYEPKNLKKTFDQVKESSESVWLYEFIFEVYVGDAE